MGTVGRPRVLVVDDEPMCGELVERALRREYDVTVMSRGDDAIACIRAGASFEVILCDLAMPGVSGVDVFEALRAAAPAQAARMLFVTGGATSAAGIHLLSAAGDRVLFKPLDRQRLLAAVGTVAKG
jgi:DNA-binding response OmpR family regulator